jgi:hypothetical protein
LTTHHEDYDDDGCLDSEELELNAALREGVDPHNPYDCDTTFNGIAYVESTLAAETPTQPVRRWLLLARPAAAISRRADRLKQRSAKRLGAGWLPNQRRLLPLEQHAARVPASAD